MSRSEVIWKDTAQRESTNKDAYNYFISQLLIRIEMAFGMLTNKWRILRTSLFFSLKKSVGILSVYARLHNFCSLMDDDEKKELANGFEFLTKLKFVTITRANQLQVMIA